MKNYEEPELTYSDYKATENPLIRFRTVTYIDPVWGDTCTYYCFEIFKRPYFFGLLGKERWIELIQINSFSLGYDFAQDMVKHKKL